MRIGIDARLFGPKQGGLGRYVEQLILNLEELNPEAEFLIYLRKENWDDYTPSKPNFKKVLADVHWYGLKEQLFLPKIFMENPVDLMHFPHWNIPLLYNKPFVVTLHDLLLLHYPTREASTLGPVTYFFKQLAFRSVLGHAVKKAKKIITISNFSKQDIEKTLAVNGDKINVTYPSSVSLPPHSNSDLLTKLKISKPFALYVGSAFPHKNLDRLLEAWKLFSEKNEQRYQLVLSGRKNYFYEKLLKKYSDLFDCQSVIFTDFLTDEQLSLLYDSSSLFVFPSLYEGFGIPPLDAMRIGVPVAASNATCIPEILQGAALYFDPLKTEEIAVAIDTGFTDDSLRGELANLGQKIVHKYSWQKLAKDTWEIYKNVV